MSERRPWTPGQWRSKAERIDAPDSDVATVRWYADGYWYGSGNRADAALIAFAPEMAEAILRSSGEHDNWQGHEAKWCSVCRAADKLRAIMREGTVNA